MNFDDYMKTAFLADSAERFYKSTLNKTLKELNVKIPKDVTILTATVEERTKGK